MSYSKKRLQLIYTLLIVFVLSSICNASGLKENFEKGEQAYNAGQYDKAIEYFEKVVEIDSNFGPVYNSLGLAYSNSDADLSDIIWFFKVATEIDPNYIDAYNNMCRVYYQAGEHVLAEQSCLKVLEINPNYTQTQLTLAWIYLVGKSQPQEAIYYFNEVLKRVRNPIIYFGLGLAYSMNGDSGQVLDTVTTLRQIGEEQLAAQLENTLRSYYDVPEMPQLPVSLPRRKTGQIVGVQKPEVEQEVKQDIPAPSGQMRIR